MRFVVFDTGTGGRLFAGALRAAFPEDDVIEVIDEAHAPYGGRSEAEIWELTGAALAGYLDVADVVVLACNTATAVCLERLRAKYPEQKFVGFEPMLKPAVGLTRTGKIIVLATGATKQSERYGELKRKYCGGVEVFEPDCGDFAAKIDAGALTDGDLWRALGLGLEGGADVIVLACTHYVAVEGEIRALAPGVQVISPFEAVIRHIRENVL